MISTVDSRSSCLAFGCSSSSAPSVWYGRASSPRISVAPLRRCRVSRSTSSSSHSTPRLDRGEDENGMCTRTVLPRRPPVQPSGGSGAGLITSGVRARLPTFLALLLLPAPPVHRLLGALPDPPLDPAEDEEGQGDEPVPHLGGGTVLDEHADDLDHEAGRVEHHEPAQA